MKLKSQTGLCPTYSLDASPRSQDTTTTEGALGAPLSPSVVTLGRFGQFRTPSLGVVP